MQDKRKTRRLAAIVAADVAGFSRMMCADEEGTLNALQQCQERHINPAIEAFGGRVVKTMGDGLLIEFASVVDAVCCSIRIHKAMRERNAEFSTDKCVDYRIGINVGDVIVEDDDIFGDCVNVAARLESLSDPGGICISETALSQVRGRVEVSVEDMGPRALKNIDTPVRTFRIREAHVSDTQNPAEIEEETDQAFALPSERPSLAILPFRNVGPSADADYIADGIALGIQTLLVQLPNMFLVNACKHEGYRRKEVSAADALSNMPVRYAVEGWTQQAGDRVRVNVQVTDLKSSAAIWAETYDRELSDIFDLQDEIARRIAAELSIELIGGHLARDFTGGLDSPGAWEHFLRGINFFYRMTKPDFQLAIPHFEALAEAHPDSAIGPCYLAVIHFYAAKRRWEIADDGDLARAELWARRAIRFEDGNNGLGHAVLGALALERHRHAESLDYCRTAVAYRSSCPFAHGQMAMTQTYGGDPSSGIKHVRHAISMRLLKPQPLELNVLAIAHRDHGDMQLSIPAAIEATRIDPDFLDAYVTLCTDFVLSGDDDQASSVAKQIKALDPRFSVAAYVSTLPYRDPDRVDRIGAALRSAGLGD